ncbi:MAG: hypothetical protein ACLQU5_16440 [Isosphaeraceae bacterium]
MRKTSLKSLTILGGALALVLGLAGPSVAQESHDHAAATHGGAQAQTKHYHFDATFSTTGLKLTVHGPDHKSVDVSGLSAKATFYHPNTARPWFTRALRPSAAGQDRIPTSLELAMNLSKVPAKEAKVVFQVSGLPDPGEPTATFTVPFTLGDDGSITVGKVTKADEKAIAAQRVCPVSGEELGGEMGPPVKVTRGDSAIFLCCKNCLKKVQADPDKFFSASAAPHAEAGNLHH